MRSWLNGPAGASAPTWSSRMALDGIEAGDAGIVAHDLAKQVLAGLSAGVRGRYPQVA